MWKLVTQKVITSPPPTHKILKYWTIYRTTLALSTHVHRIINSFWKIHFNKCNIPKYALLSFTIFFDLKEIIFENFNISENNIISVKLAKVLGYIPCGSFKCYSLQRRCYHTGQSMWVRNQSSSTRFGEGCMFLLWASCAHLHIQTQFHII